MLNGKPAFQVSIPINIEWPGTVPTAPGYVLIPPGNVESADPDFLVKNKIVGGSWVDETGRPYSGDTPYILIALDGKNNDQLERFIPTALTASVMSQFFGVKDGQAEATSLLTDAFTLYNDFQFRQQVDTIGKKIASLNPNASDYATDKQLLEQQRARLLKNILTPELQPRN
jgi:hypothetical protein